MYFVSCGNTVDLSKWLDYTAFPADRVRLELYVHMYACAVHMHTGFGQVAGLHGLPRRQGEGARCMVLRAHRHVRTSACRLHEVLPR